MSDEGLDLADPSRAVLHLGDGRSVSLRTPKFGEYQRLREDLYGRLDSIRGATEAHASPAPLDAALLGWLQEAVGVLGVEGSLPDVDELPAWLADPTLPGELLAHWVKRPTSAASR